MIEKEDIDIIDKLYTAFYGMNILVVFVESMDWHRYSLHLKNEGYCLSYKGTNMCRLSKFPDTRIDLQIFNTKNDDGEYDMIFCDSRISETYKENLLYKKLKTENFPIFSIKMVDIEEEI